MEYSKLKWNYFVLPAILFSLFILSIASAFSDDQPYCALRYRRLCQGKGPHVGCQYPYPGPGEECRNYTQIKFTAKLRHYIVNYINRRRQRVASGAERGRGGALIPKPQVMMMVVWDRELAVLAQRLADQCSFIHDDCRATVRYPYAGQTVGEVRWRGSISESDSMSAQRAVRRVFDAWWGERRRVQPQQLTTPFRLGTKGSPWGHFSQLAVWTLAAAGCGAARHGNPRRLLLVCDFSHTNMLGQSTLIPGELVPCPAQSARKSRSAYPLLCAPIRVPDQSGNDENEEYHSYEEYAPKFANEEDTISSTIDTKVPYTYWIQTKETRERPHPSIFTNATRPLFTGKPHQEPDVQTAAQYTTTKYIKRISTQINFEDDREYRDREVGLKARLKINKPKPYSRSTEEIIVDMTRRKWKQTRQRPRRPGADALISRPVDKMFKHSSVASLRLDREDMEQLFLDTGFHEHWKKKPLS